MMPKSGVSSIYERGTLPKSIVTISNLFLSAVKDFENVGTFKPFQKIYKHFYVFSEDETCANVIRKQKIKLGDLHAVSTDILEDDTLVVYQVLDAYGIEESEVINEMKKGNVVEYSKEKDYFYVIPAETY